MTPAQAHQLAQVTQALLAREQRAMHALRAEEHDLRTALARLDALDRRNRPGREDHRVMQRVGVDLLWQGWLNRTRARLNSELARVLARKQPLLERSRIAFGRDAAVGHLLTAAREKRSRARRLG